MTMLASQITSFTVVYSIVYSGVNQRKHQSSASLAFVWEIHRGPVNFPHKWPVTRKMFPFDDVIMKSTCIKPQHNRVQASYSVHTRAYSISHQLNLWFCGAFFCRGYFCYHDGVIKWKYFLRYWPLCGEFTGIRLIPKTKASDAELWCFLWSAPDYKVE